MGTGREAGSSGRAGSSRGARPDAAGTERPSERGVRRRSRASATARARRVLEWGGDGAAQRGNSGAAAGQQARAVQRRSSEHGSAQRSSAGSEGREREKREKEREVRELTLNFLKIFNGSSKKFEYKSCSKFKILPLSFQAHFHLRFGLKVTNSNLNAKENTLYTLFFEFLSNFCVLT